MSQGIAGSDYCTTVVKSKSGMKGTIFSTEAESSQSVHVIDYARKEILAPHGPPRDEDFMDFEGYARAESK